MALGSMKCIPHLVMILQLLLKIYFLIIIVLKRLIDPDGEFPYIILVVVYNSIDSSYYGDGYS